MANNKLRLKEYSEEKRAKEPEKVNWRLFLAAVFSTAFIFGVYYLCVSFAFAPIVYIYVGAATLLLILYYITNRGFSNKPLDKDDLPVAWPEEKRESFALKLNKRRKRTKLLLIPIMGIMFTLAFDIIYLFYIEPLL